MTQQIKNPFLHQHDHHHHHDDGHDHDHEHGHDHHLEELDPAQQSLSDALRVSFLILKAVMVVLLVLYLFSGVFSVTEGQEQAVRLRFGRIVGRPGQQVYERGWHLGLPYPIERVIKVPVAPRQVSLANAFWYEVAPQDQGKRPDELRGRPLNPEKDGSLLTGDANIIHGRFRLSYRVQDAAAFVQNVGLAVEGVTPLPDGSIASDKMALADALVRYVAEQGVVHAVAQSDVDTVVRQQILNSTAAMGAMQRVLDEMDAGIVIQSFSFVQSEMPLSVRGAYQAATSAVNEKEQQIQQARQEQAQILGQTAGEAYTALDQLIGEYEEARNLGQEDRAAALLRELDASLARLRMSPERGGAAIGGQVAELINEAVTFRTALVEQIKAEASTFRAFLPEYRRSPNLVLSQIWQAAREQILSSDGVETFYAVPGHLYIEQNRDPQIQRRREQQRLQQEQEQLRQQGQQR